ncbi:MAG: WD40 repeat domain-containing protein [Microcoleus sp.]
MTQNQPTKLEAHQQVKFKSMEIEKAGHDALELFKSDGHQIEALRAAIKAGENLKTWMLNHRAVTTYPSTSPLLALQVILSKIRERHQFVGHRSTVRSVCFSPNQDAIATASQDGTAKLWDLQGNLLADYSGYKGNLLKGEADFVELKTPIYSICFSRDGKFLITGSQDGKVRFWPVETLDDLLVRGREWLGEKF